MKLRAHSSDSLVALDQLKALRAAKGAWKHKDHPELKDGAAAWVRTMRAEASGRYRKIERHRGDAG